MELVAKSHPESKLELTKIAYGDQDQDRDEINAIIRVLHDAFGDDAKLYREHKGIGDLALNFGPNDEKHAKYEKAARSLFTAKNGAFREEKE